MVHSSQPDLDVVAELLLIYFKATAGDKLIAYGANCWTLGFGILHLTLRVV